MEEQIGKIIPIAIEDEVKESYLNYAMSVIVSRALPDVRDGLKPVHRRILYAMNEMGLRYDQSYKKCGRIVGDVLGKYHPHGDISIYDALVRLAQPFSMRYPVVRGQGNFGSVDGDPPAAMRYTEAKMERISEEILRDIKKDTVEFGLNYDDSMEEPKILPSAVPYLLINGASGIAVGMATNMPPHNLKEVCEAIIAFIENPEISVTELIKYVTGPDFPTGGIIFGTKGLRDAYTTGKGKITVRGRCTLETGKSGKETIIITEIPYQVNKASLVVKIAELVRDKRIDGIQDLRDESDRDGMRIVIELKKGVVPKVILNQLFSLTPLQQNFSVINLALVDGRPQTLTLKQLIHYFVEHRKIVVVRRAQFDLKKAEDRAHILEGLKIALDNIDEVIRIIKQSGNADIAREGLMERFKLSEKQAQAILDMRLQRLTSLETRKIVDELEEVRKLIAHLKDLLAHEDKIYHVITDETKELITKYGDERRTEIVRGEIEEFNIEDLIQKEDMVVLISNKGFIKRIAVSSYRIQGRGGKGSASATLKNEDFLEHIFVASTHDYILFITSEGKAYWIKVHEIPEASRIARGQSIKTLLAISQNEDITAIVSLKAFNEDSFIFMATRAGIVKKVTTSAFVNARTHGIIAIRLTPGDKLIRAMLTSGENEVVLLTRKGRALRFHESDVRPSGRSSQGVRGLNIRNNDELTAALCVTPEEAMVIITESGFGKRLGYDNFLIHSRGTMGQRAYPVLEKTGEIIGALSVKEMDDIVCITSQGNTIRLSAEQIPEQGTSARGVCIVNIQKPDFLVGTARVIPEEE
ncbi:MAG: DNA gyrase subunit A [Spirochaetales bacterium]|nr:MAG: DNA gyrase subunit A [Spirochaetales bacterium]